MHEEELMDYSLEVVVVMKELQKELAQGLSVGSGGQFQRLLYDNVVYLLITTELLRELLLQTGQHGRLSAT